MSHADVVRRRIALEVGDVECEQGAVMVKRDQ